mgnify:CR=1 FL=1
MRATNTSHSAAVIVLKDICKIVVGLVQLGTTIKASKAVIQLTTSISIDVTVFAKSVDHNTFDVSYRRSRLKVILCERFD